MIRELSERIFNDVGNIDYIYTVIQECVDEATEEQYMLQCNRRWFDGHHKLKCSIGELDKSIVELSKA